MDRIIRLSVLFTALGLIVSRISLILHEFAGHGLAALAAGGTITDFHLFVFSGGRINYVFDRPLYFAQQMTVSLAGVLLELLAGLALVLLSRRLGPGSLARFSVFAFGAVDILHGWVYLVRGMHYGFGDGAILYHLLGETARLGVALGAAVVLVTGFLASRRFAGLLRHWIQARSVVGFALPVAVAIACAAGVHLGLSKGERAIFPDENYKQIMLAGHEKRARLEVMAHLAALKKAGEPLPSFEAVRALQERLERKYKPFALDPWLFGSLIAAVLAGIYCGHREAPDKPPAHKEAKTQNGTSLPSWSQTARLLWVLAGALALVIGLRVFQ